MQSPSTYNLVEPQSNLKEERRLKIQFGDPYWSLEICSISGSLPDNSGELAYNMRYLYMYPCVSMWVIVFLCKLTLLIYVNIYSSVNPGTVSYCPRSDRPLFHINTEVQLKIEFTCNHINSPRLNWAWMWEKNFQVLV